MVPSIRQRPSAPISMHQAAASPTKSPDKTYELEHDALAQKLDEEPTNVVEQETTAATLCKKGSDSSKSGILVSDDSDTSEKPDMHTDEVLTSVLLAVIQVAVVLVFSGEDFRWSVTMDVISYGHFRDVSLMIFFGFGFLMTFLHHHGLSAIGYCLVVSAVVVEISVAVEYLVLPRAKELTINEVTIDNLMNGLFCAGAVMISFGAVIGKVTPFQILLMAVIEVFAFWVNFRLATIENLAHDVGGGMVIHVFGAYFGLAACFWLTRRNALNHPAEKSIYSADLFSLAGTIILWVLWPSFQSAVAGDPQRQMLATGNTFLSLCSSSIAFAVISRSINGGRFNVVHMQNATLAGGVVMGVAGDMEMGLHGAMLSGFLAGGLSCLGYAKIQPLITNLNIHDTCGVNNLHGMPGILGAIVGIVVTGVHDSKPGVHDTKGFEGATAGTQTIALLITIGMSIGFGTLAGIAMSLPLRHFGVFVADEDHFSDAVFFDESSCTVQKDFPARDSPVKTVNLILE